MQLARPRRGIAGAPEGQVELRVVVGGEPHRDPARLPRLALPGVVTGLAGSRNRVRLPDRLAVLRVEGGDVATDTELAARGAHHHLAPGDEWGQREVVALLVVVDRGVPHDLAG